MALQTGKDEILLVARRTVAQEAEALAGLAAALDDQFVALTQRLAEPHGATFICGVGKSALVARKIAGTLASVGVKAVFLAPSDALHGEMGMIHGGDLVLALSKSGASEELVALAVAARQRQAHVAAIVCRAPSPLSRVADWTVHVPVLAEATAVPLPTSSALAMIALGDALAAAVMGVRNFTAEDFARNHPGGNLGALLASTVADVMHRAPEEVATVTTTDPVWQVLVAMTAHPFGCALVVDEHRHLVGIITDGDVRRAVSKGDGADMLRGQAGSMMTRDPLACAPTTTALEALNLMERGTRKEVYVLPVVDAERRLLGLVRMHELARLQLRNGDA